MYRKSDRPNNSNSIGTLLRFSAKRALKRNNVPNIDSEQEQIERISNLS